MLVELGVVNSGSRRRWRPPADTVRVETDLGPGWATSVEHTALDLCRNRPAWNITDEARAEMIRRLADRIDWDLIDEIAEATRGVKTLRRLRTMLDHPQP